MTGTWAWTALGSMEAMWPSSWTPSAALDRGDGRRELGQVRQGGVGERRVLAFRLPVDPDPANPQLAGGPNVVEVALGNMDPPGPVRRDRCLEAAEVGGRRLVCADVFRRHHGVERHWQTPLREGDEVAVAVREQCQPPAVTPQAAER